MRFAIFVLLPLSLLTALLACSPRFDWREIKGARYTVWLPAKPATLTRTIVIGGHPTEMTMTGAQAGGADFAIGILQLQAGETAEETIAAMRAGMLKNIDAKSPHNLPSDVLRAEGKDAQGRTVKLALKYVVADTRIFQLAALGSDLPDDAVETFMASFKPQ